MWHRHVAVLTVLMTLCGLALEAAASSNSGGGSHRGRSRKSGKAPPKRSNSGRRRPAAAKPTPPEQWSNNKQQLHSRMGHIVMISTKYVNGYIKFIDEEELDEWAPAVPVRTELLTQTPYDDVVIDPRLYHLCNYLASSMRSDVGRLRVHQLFLARLWDTAVTNLVQQRDFGLLRGQEVPVDRQIIHISVNDKLFQFMELYRKQICEKDAILPHKWQTIRSMVTAVFDYSPLDRKLHIRMAYDVDQLIAITNIIDNFFRLTNQQVQTRRRMPIEPELASVHLDDAISAVYRLPFTTNVANFVSADSPLRIYNVWLRAVVLNAKRAYDEAFGYHPTVQQHVNKTIDYEDAYQSSLTNPEEKEAAKAFEFRCDVELMDGNELIAIHHVKPWEEIQDIGQIILEYCSQLLAAFDVYERVFKNELITPKFKIDSSLVHTYLDSAVKKAKEKYEQPVRALFYSVVAIMSLDFFRDQNRYELSTLPPMDANMYSMARSRLNNQRQEIVGQSSTMNEAWRMFQRIKLRVHYDPQDRTVTLWKSIDPEMFPKMNQAIKEYAAHASELCTLEAARTSELYPKVSAEQLRKLLDAKTPERRAAVELALAAQALSSMVAHNPEHLHLVREDWTRWEDMAHKLYECAQRLIGEQKGLSSYYKRALSYDLRADYKHDEFEDQTRIYLYLA